MEQKLDILIENYKDGVPVKFERTSLIWLAAVELLVIVLGAGIVKIVKNL